MIETHLKNIEAAIAAIRSELLKPKPSLPVIIPYVECPFPRAVISGTEITFQENAYQGLSEWIGVVEGAIVVTRPEYAAELYNDLRALYGIRITPGLKSNHQGVRGVKDPWDANGWAEFAAAIYQTWNATDCKRMVLDFEETSRSWVESGGTPQWRVFERFASMLPGDLELIFYPGPLWPGKPDDAQVRLREMIARLDGPKRRFVSQRYDRPVAHQTGAWSTAEEWGNRYLLERQPELSYFFNNSLYWHDADLLSMLENIVAMQDEDTEVFLYPGYSRWVEFSAYAAKVVKEAKA